MHGARRHVYAALHACPGKKEPATAAKGTGDGSRKKGCGFLITRTQRTGNRGQGDRHPGHRNTAPLDTSDPNQIV